MLDRKQSEFGTGRGSYAVILLVSPLGSLTIAKLNGWSIVLFRSFFLVVYVYHYFRIS